MLVYAVRIFKDKQWLTIRHYATQEAAEFSQAHWTLNGTLKRRH
jgi:hypothetical protein